MKKKIKFIGAGVGIGQDLSGVELGPAAWMRALNPLQADLVYDGDLGEISLRPVHLRSNRDSRGFPFHVYDRVASKIESTQKEMTLPVTLGGDHSIAIGTVEGSLRNFQDLKLVWIDAHGDINTPETTLSGRVHGMPLAYLLGLWAQDRERLRLHERNIVLFGVRDLDTGEKRIIKDLGIRTYTQKEIISRGIANCWAEVESYLSLSSSPVHVSFDVDAIDPKLFPQTGVPVRRGLNAAELDFVFSKISMLPQLVALDIVEFNPLIRSEGPNATAGQELIARILIKELISNKPNLSGGSIEHLHAGIGFP